MTKVEYKLFRTKSKLSSLLTSIDQTSDNKQTEESFYILTEFKRNTYESNDRLDDSSLNSIWFNRANGQLSLKKSKILLFFRF